MAQVTAVEKVYFAFYSTKKEKLYFSELLALTKLSISSLQNVLKTLQKDHEVVKTKERAHAYYSLSNKQAATRFFIKFDQEKLNDLTPDIRVVTKKFLEVKQHSSDNATAFIFLFGSTTRKKERPESDIDLFIVLHTFAGTKLQKEYETQISKTCTAAKEQADALSQYPLSISYATIQEFLNSPDRLIREARETGFCIEGHQLYYDITLP